METTSKFKVRLGIFVAAGLFIFIVAIFFIGRQKHLFSSVFTLSTKLKSVSGLQIGNNVRYSGINVGTVDNITILNDSTVKVDMILEKEVQKFIQSDCSVVIGSEGIIGDRVVNITQGEGTGSPVKNGQNLRSIEPVETDEIIASLKVTVENAEIISGQLAEMLFSINQGNGTLGKLLKDSTIAGDFSQTMGNLKKSTEGLNENMEAAKSNFLLKGYFKKKEKEKQKEQERLEKEKQTEQNK